MKRYFYWMALVTIIGFGYTSCDEDDDNTCGISVSLEEPATKESAAIYTLEEKIAIGDKLISEIEVTEENGIIISYGDDDSQEGTNEQIKDWEWYNFAKDGDKLTVSGFGEITIKKQDNETVLLCLLPEGYNTPIVVVADVTKPYLTDELSCYLCRTWKVFEYCVKGNVSRTNVGTSWKKVDGDCNIYEIMKDINENHNANLDLDLKGKEIIESITFTANGTFQIKYKGTSDMDEGYWNWLESSKNETDKKGSIVYRWHKEKMGNDMLDGKDVVTFKNNICTMLLPAKAGKRCDVTLEIRMK